MACWSVLTSSGYQDAFLWVCRLPSRARSCQGRSATGGRKRAQPQLCVEGLHDLGKVTDLPRPQRTGSVTHVQPCPKGSGEIKVPSALGHPVSSLSGGDYIGPAASSQHWEATAGRGSRGRRQALGVLENLVAEEHLGQGLLLPGLCEGLSQARPFVLVFGQHPTLLAKREHK